MKKRLISILLTISIVLSMFSFFAYADDYTMVCPDCGATLYYESGSISFGNIEYTVVTCPDCSSLLGTSGRYCYLSAGEWIELSAGDSAIIDEYYTSAYNGTGGSYETTTDDDGNTTTDYVANDTSNWYVTSDGQIQGKFVSYMGYSTSLIDGYGFRTSSSWIGTYDTLYFYYSNVSVPYSGDYTYSYSDFGIFYTYTSNNVFYSTDSSDYYLHSTTIPSSIGSSGSSATYYFCFCSSLTSDDDNYYRTNGGCYIQVWSPILYLTYDPTAYGFISNDYSSVTVNGDIITGDSIYYYDYTSNYSTVNSSYSGAYYVYDSSDSGNYTVYNTDSSGDVVSSYYYDNSSGDTITYMTIYESDTFTPEEMYPSDTGDDSTSSDSSDNAWTELFSDLFGGIADFLAAIISGVLELLIALVDELVSAVTSLLDTVTSLFTSVLDFGGEFSGFIGSFFDWMPDEIVVLLQLSIALPLLLMVIKFLINLFV